MEKGKYDVVVIGSGIGGLSAAALLAKEGYRVLVTEKLERLGGRFSTIEYAGFKMPTSAIAIELGGQLESVFRDTGAEFQVTPVNRVFYWIEGKYYELPEKGGMRALLDILNRVEADKAKIVGSLAKEVAVEKFMSAFRDGASLRERPERQVSFRDWLLKHTDSEKVLAVFQAIIAANHGINSWELPAVEFFAFVSRQGGYRRYGHATRGNIVLAEALAQTVRARGGEAWTGAEARKILVKDGRAAGVVVERDGKETEIAAPVVISNVGPRETVALAGRVNFGTVYLDEMNRRIRPAPIVTILAASEEPLVTVPGMMFPIGASRVCSCFPVTTPCPELAPAGQHLTVIFGQPLSSLQPLNGRQEIEANIKDLMEIFPDFARKAAILRTDVRNIDDEWPCYRTWPGYDLAPGTPVRGLYNVGDGVKPFGKVGLPSCAETGRIVAEEVKRLFRSAG